MKVKEQLEKLKQKDFSINLEYEEWLRDFIKPLSSSEIDNIEKECKSKSPNVRFALKSFGCNNKHYVPIPPLVGA